MKSIKKVIVITGLFAVSSINANGLLEDLRPYRVVKTEITNVTPFCIAVAKGDFELVKKLIELGGNVNQLSNNMTPLMYASRYNHIEIIKLLVANGARVTTKNLAGRTALDIAKNSNASNALVLLQTLKRG